MPKTYRKASPPVMTSKVWRSLIEEIFLMSCWEQSTFALIITFDLVGFEQTTLMDGILYNLVSSKFLNFMLRKNLANEKFLSRQLSISMFFYCRGVFCKYKLPLGIFIIQETVWNRK